MRSGCNVGWKEYILNWNRLRVHRHCNAHDIERIYFTIRQNLRSRIFIKIVKYYKYDDIFFPTMKWPTMKIRCSKMCHNGKFIFLLTRWGLCSWHCLMMWVYVLLSIFFCKRKTGRLSLIKTFDVTKMTTQM